MCPGLLGGQNLVIPSHTTPTTATPFPLQLQQSANSSSNGSVEAPLPLNCVTNMVMKELPQDSAPALIFDQVFSYPGLTPAFFVSAVGPRGLRSGLQTVDCFYDRRNYPETVDIRSISAQPSEKDTSSLVVRFTLPCGQDQSYTNGRPDSYAVGVAPLDDSSDCEGRCGQVMGGQAHVTQRTIKGSLRDQVVFPLSHLQPQSRYCVGVNIAGHSEILKGNKWRCIVASTGKEDSSNPGWIIALGVTCPILLVIAILCIIYKCRARYDKLERQFGNMDLKHGRSVDTPTVEDADGKTEGADNPAFSREDSLLLSTTEEVQILIPEQTPWSDATVVELAVEDSAGVRETASCPSQDMSSDSTNSYDDENSDDAELSQSDNDIGETAGINLRYHSQPSHDAAADAEVEDCKNNDGDENSDDTEMSQSDDFRDDTACDGDRYRSQPLHNAAVNPEDDSSILLLDGRYPSMMLVASDENACPQRVFGRPNMIEDDDEEEERSDSLKERDDEEGNASDNVSEKDVLERGGLMNYSVEKSPVSSCDGQAGGDQLLSPLTSSVREPIAPDPNAAIDIDRILPGTESITSGSELTVSSPLSSVPAPGPQLILSDAAASHPAFQPESTPHFFPSSQQPQFIQTVALLGVIQEPDLHVTDSSASQDHFSPSLDVNIEAILQSVEGTSARFQLSPSMDVGQRLEGGSGDSGNDLLSQSYTYDRQPADIENSLQVLGADAAGMNAKQNDPHALTQGIFPSSPLTGKPMQSLSNPSLIKVGIREASALQELYKETGRSIPLDLDIIHRAAAQCELTVSPEVEHSRKNFQYQRNLPDRRSLLLCSQESGFRDLGSSTESELENLPDSPFSADDSDSKEASVRDDQCLVNHSGSSSGEFEDRSSGHPSKKSYLSFDHIKHDEVINVDLSSDRC